MRKNMGNFYNEGKPSTCCAFMLAHSKEQELGWTKADVQAQILTGAEYRCKKALTGLLREMYTITALTVTMQPEGIRIPQNPCTVWWHPLLDCVGKCDAIVQPHDQDRNPTPLAVYLRTQKSAHHIEFRKANGVLAGKLLNVAVQCEAHLGVEDAIFLPNAQQLFTLRMAINGSKAAIHMMQGAYS